MIAKQLTLTFEIIYCRLIFIYCLRFCILLTIRSKIMKSLLYYYTRNKHGKNIVFSNITSVVYIYIYIYIYIYYILYIYVYICCIYNYFYHNYIYLVFPTEGFLEVAIESWPEWDLMYIQENF